MVQSARAWVRRPFNAATIQAMRRNFCGCSLAPTPALPASALAGQLTSHGHQSGAQVFRSRSHGAHRRIDMLDGALRCGR